MEGKLLDLTYVNYKVAEGKLFEWLFDNADRHGVNLPEVKMKRLGPNNTRRRFKNAEDYSILATLLSTYTGSGVRFLPTLALVIRQAIKLRETQAGKIPDTKRHRAGNETHRQFIEELKLVLRILENTTGDLNLGGLRSSTLCSSDIVAAVWPERLECEEFTPTIALDGELDGSQFEERVAICTFFEEMESIRDIVAETWEDYAAVLNEGVFES